jgi:hypothetical protein
VGFFRDWAYRSWEKAFNLLNNVERLNGGA